MWTPSKAWNVTTGSEIRVAVLDSGVASDNADIAPKVVARANFSAYSVVGRRMYRRQYSTLFPGRAVPETL